MRLECGAGTANANTHEALLNIPTLRPGDEKRRCVRRALRKILWRSSEREIGGRREAIVA